MVQIDINSLNLHLISTPLTTWLILGALITLLALYMLTHRRKLLVQLPGPPAGKWTTGHFKDILGAHGAEFQERLVSTYGPTTKLNGAFGDEIIFTIDPAVMHSLLVKDRAKFERPQGATLMIRSVFGGGLLGLKGEDHRIHRKLLNPVFTMKFLRELMPIFMDIAKQTCQGIKKDLSASKSSSKVVDVFPWATVAALELIGEAGLGYSFNSFTGERNEYNNAIKSVMQVFSKMNPYIKVLPYIYRVGTPGFRRWALQYVPSAAIQQLRYATGVQNKQAEEVLRARQALISSGADLSSQAGRGRDIMTLLMRANEAEGSEFHIDRQTMVGHMNTFIFAGHETTSFGSATYIAVCVTLMYYLDLFSTAVARILDVLANRPRVQVKLREEIRQYFEENPDDSHYDDLLELPYLDAVVRETLRLYGPVSLLSRVCEEDAHIPLEYPIDTPSGKITSIPVRRGTRILMSITMSNRYGKIWGERTHEFSLERWIGSKLEEVTQPGAHLPGVYSSMMTFGAGSRACIGFKFAIMEIKVMIAQLIKDFKFEPSQEEFD